MRNIVAIKCVTNRLVEASPYMDEPFLSRGSEKAAPFEEAPHRHGIDYAFGAIADESERLGDPIVFEEFIPIEKAVSKEDLKAIEAFCSKGIIVGSQMKGRSSLFRAWADYLLRSYDGYCKAKSPEYCDIFGLETKNPLHLSNVELAIARIYIRHGEPESLEAAEKVLGTAIKRKDALVKGNRADSTRYLAVLTELFAEHSYISYRRGDIEKSKKSSDKAAAFADALEKRMDKNDKNDVRDWMALIDAFTQKAFLMQEGVLATDEKIFQKLMGLTREALALPASHAGSFKERLENNYRLAIR